MEEDSTLQPPPASPVPPAAPAPEAAPPPPQSLASTDGTELAGRTRRFFGALVDGMIGGAIALVVLYATGDFESLAAARDGESPDFVVLATNQLIAVSLFIALNLVPWERYGQSLGKMVAGTKIVRTDGSAAGLDRIIGRRTLPWQLVGVVPVIGSFIQMIDILAIFRSSRACLHDSFADTKVIRA